MNNEGECAKKPAAVNKPQAQQSKKPNNEQSDVTPSRIQIKPQSTNPEHSKAKNQ
jgi:hypothetical protein